MKCIIERVVSPLCLESYPDYLLVINSGRLRSCYTGDMFITIKLDKIIFCGSSCTKITRQKYLPLFRIFNNILLQTAEMSLRKKKSNSSKKKKRKSHKKWFDNDLLKIK